MKRKTRKSIWVREDDEDVVRRRLAKQRKLKALEDEYKIPEYTSWVTPDSDWDDHEGE